MGEVIGQIILEWILAGIWWLLNSIYDWIKGLIFGIPKSEVELKRIEKKWLYKKVSPKKKYTTA